MKLYVLCVFAVLRLRADRCVQINFLNMDDAEVEGTKSNLLRTLGAATS